MTKIKEMINHASIRNMIFVGVVLLLVGIILDQLSDSAVWLNTVPILITIKYIVVQFIIGIGIAIIISAIFSWIIGTESFLEFIDEKILKKMSSPEYVENLSDEAKKQLLKEVMKPGVEVSNIYTPTNSYFENQIQKSLKMFKNSFRSDLSMKCKSFFNETSGKVETISSVTYKTYRFEGKHESICIGVENENVKLGEATIYLEKGGIHKVSFELVDKEDDRVSDAFKKEDSIKKVAICMMPELVQNEDSFLIKRVITEEGEDHWHHFSYRAIMPIHGLNLTLECEEGLIIKDVLTYGRNGVFGVELSEDKKEVEVISANWIEPGFGLSIIIAKK